MIEKNKSGTRRRSWGGVAVGKRKKGPKEKGISEQKNKRHEGKSHINNCRKSFPDRGNRSAELRNSKGVSAAGVQGRTEPMTDGTEEPGRSWSALEAIVRILLFTLRLIGSHRMFELRRTMK